MVDTVLYNKKNIDYVAKKIIDNKIDLGAVVCFKILPKKIWDLPKYKTINLHYSLLYSYGGPNPVEWQLYNGEKYTGASVHYISKEIDKGALIAQNKIKMPQFKFILNVYNKLEPVGKKQC